MTDTRSCARRCPNHSEVMIETIDAEDAWCPPTFIPPGLGRTRFAWSMIAVDSHSTWRSISLSARMLSVCGGDWMMSAMRA